MVDDQENLDPEDKKEDSFEFDSAGEAVEYISLEQAHVFSQCKPPRENLGTTVLPSRASTCSSRLWMRK